MAWVNTKAILDALVMTLTGIQLEGVAEPAFQEVRRYKTPDIKRALEDLLVFEDRPCFVVPDGNIFATQLAGRVLQTRCTRQVALLLADRDYGDPQAAQEGDVDTVGVIELDRLVTNRIHGAQLDLGVVVTVARSQPLTISKKDQDNSLSGRAAWVIDLDVDAGIQRKTLSR